VTAEPEPRASGAERLEHALASTIGTRLRAYRIERGLTIAQLAEDSGISKGMLSKVENRHTAASLSTLARLADALSIPVTALFRGLEEEHEAYFVPKGKGLETTPARGSSGSLNELLGDTRGPHKRIEPIRVRITEPIDPFPLYQHAGTEFLHVLEGSMEYGYGNSRYKLNPGDSLVFEGEVPHGPTKLITLPVEFLSVKAWGRVE
jgi:transcriptional regulator with XRE-family HTH domain